ncbi:DUF2500 domain-containing protein [Corallococcus sp. AB050B]|nr:DUF2500 domain-containing protein [Corallococcus sp. AB050B]
MCFSLPVCAAAGGQVRPSPLAFTSWVSSMETRAKEETLLARRGADGAIGWWSRVRPEGASVVQPPIPAWLSAGARNAQHCRGPRLQEREERPHLLVAASVAGPRDRPRGGESMELLIILFFFACMALVCIALAALVFHFFRGRRLEPVLKRPGRVVAKRQAFTSYGAIASYGQAYFVTFEFQDGSRDEFETFDRQYGLLAEGDQGTLTTQGRRLTGFARQRPQRGPGLPRPLPT